MHLSDFDYELPEELIAQHPSVERGHSRLMHVDAVRAQIADRRFADLPRYVAAGDVVVLNDTRVLKARLHATKTTGGQVEILVERLLDARSALVMLRASRKPRPGERLTLRDGSGATVGQREGDLFELRFDEDAMPALERLGEIPLPPCIARPAGPADEARYQTVYATAPGAIAAPSHTSFGRRTALTAAMSAPAMSAIDTISRPVVQTLASAYVIPEKIVWSS